MKPIVLIIRHQILASKKFDTSYGIIKELHFVSILGFIKAHDCSQPVVEQPPTLALQAVSRDLLTNRK